MEYQEIINEFEGEVIVLNFITVARLFELDTDAATLYLFYVKNAKIQKTNKIYAVNKFSMVGLGWGRDKFLRAKKILQDNRFISTIIRKDDKGKITGHYLVIHYLNSEKLGLSSGPENHTVDAPTLWTKPHCGFQNTNAYNKNINAYNKEKEMLSELSKDNSQRNGEVSHLFSAITEEHEIVLKHWNGLAKGVIGVNGHKSLYSKCAVDKKTRQGKSPLPLVAEIINFCLTKHQLSDILQGIDNYFNILVDSDYFYTYKFKNLAVFLHSPKGLRYFLKPDYGALRHKNITVDIFSEIRRGLKLVTVECDVLNPLNKDNSSYLGFSLDILRKVDPLYYFNEIKSRIKHDELEQSHLSWIEEAIATLILKKENLALLKQLLMVHIDYKKKFKMGGV